MRLEIYLQEKEQAIIVKEKALQNRAEKNNEQSTHETEAEDIYENLLRQKGQIIKFEM